MRKLLCSLGLVTGKRVTCVADECMLCTKGYQCVLARYLSGKISYIQAKEKIEIAGEEHYSFERAKSQVEEIVEKLDITGEGEEERAEGGIKINPLYLVVIGVVVAGILVGVGLLRIKEPREEAGVVERPKIKLRCSSCKEVFEVEKQEKPFKVKCPFCGKEGTIK